MRRLLWALGGGGEGFESQDWESRARREAREGNGEGGRGTAEEAHDTTLLFI